LQPVREIDLISRAGQCAAVAPAGDTGGLLGGVSLQMTECEVVNRLGSPDKTDFDVDGRGERMVTLTYVGGARPSSPRGRRPCGSVETMNIDLRTRNGGQRQQDTEQLGPFKEGNAVHSPLKKANATNPTTTSNA
jgi:hypothetical protein